MEELDLAGMTWFGALAAIVLLMISFVTRKRRRFDKSGYTRSEVEQLIKEAVLSQRDRSIISRRIIDGMGMERLAEEFELSVPQVKRIVYKAEDDLARVAGQK